MSEDGQACEHGHQKRGQRGPWPPLYFEILAKKVVFLVLSGKKQISPLLVTPWIKFGKIP